LRAGTPVGCHHDGCDGGDGVGVVRVDPGSNRPGWGGPGDHRFRLSFVRESTNAPHKTEAKSLEKITNNSK